MTRSYLTTRECAEILRVSAEYIRGEIRDGLLVAEVQQRKPKYGRTRSRTFIRIPLEHFRTYCRQHWPSAESRLPAA